MAYWRWLLVFQRIDHDLHIDVVHVVNQDRCKRRVIYISIRLWQVWQIISHISRWSSFISTHIDEHYAWLWRIIIRDDPFVMWYAWTVDANANVARCHLWPAKSIWDLATALSRSQSLRPLSYEECCLNIAQRLETVIRKVYIFIYHRNLTSQIARFMGPTWGPPGSCRPQMGPMLAPWTLLSGVLLDSSVTGWRLYLIDIIKSTRDPASIFQVHNSAWCGDWNWYFR